MSSTINPRQYAETAAVLGAHYDEVERSVAWERFLHQQVHIYAIVSVHGWTGEFLASMRLVCDPRCLQGLPSRARGS